MLSKQLDEEANEALAVTVIDGATWGSSASTCDWPELADGDEQLQEEFLVVPGDDLSRASGCPAMAVCPATDEFRARAESKVAYRDT